MSEAQPRSISIYDGRDLIGSVASAGRDWRAFDARGNQLRGDFKSVKAAAAAVNVSCPSPCVADARMDGSG
jgi:hypothetical protein